MKHVQAKKRGVALLGTDSELIIELVGEGSRFAIFGHEPRLPGGPALGGRGDFLMACVISSQCPVLTNVAGSIRGLSLRPSPNTAPNLPISTRFRVDRTASGPATLRLHSRP